MRSFIFYIFCSISILFLGAFKSVNYFKGPQQTNKWYAPAYADTITNSNLMNPNWIKEGSIIYKRQCIVCHGENGRGDGESGFGLDVPPGDLSDAFTINESDGSIYWKITNGREPMPNFYTKLTETQRWQTVSYIRAIQRNAVLKKKKKNK